jgi:CheY-like chemotaxis protein
VNSYKVLIAEDNKLIANLMSQILSELHIESTVTFSGMDALLAYNSDHFDLILLDIMMPYMTGFEVSTEIRKTDLSIPIVTFTSLSYDEVKDSISDSGINQYLSKPSNLRDLKILLQDFFRPAA